VSGGYLFAFGAGLMLGIWAANVSETFGVIVWLLGLGIMLAGAAIVKNRGL
jgi:hypothetical protein